MSELYEKFKRIKNLVFVAILLAVSLFLVKAIKTLFEVRAQGGLNHKTDTVYVDKYLPSKIEYKYITVPNEVVIYKEREVIKWDTLVTKGDTIILYKNDTILSSVKSNFLTLYPNNPKLIGVDLTSKKLSLSLLNSQGREYIENYNTNTGKYSYRYVNNQMSAKPRLLSSFNIDGEYYWRPLENYHDLNIKLNLKTSKFTYIGGISSYYYPNLNNQVKITPIVGIRYTP